MVDILLF